MRLDEKSLRDKGYFRQPDGSWAKSNPGFLAPLEVPIRKSDPAPALDRRAPVRQGCSKSVGVRVILVSVRKKLLDDDNLVAGLKPLRDTIARGLGIDDGDSRLVWEYSQVLTRGEEGTIVMIQV